jgi:hypothetical protein
MQLVLSLLLLLFSYLKGTREMRNFLPFHFVHSPLSIYGHWSTFRGGVIPNIFFGGLDKIVRTIFNAQYFSQKKLLYKKKFGGPGKNRRHHFNAQFFSQKKNYYLKKYFGVWQKSLTLS